MKKIIILHHVSGLGGGTKSMIDIANMLKDTYKVTICIPRNSDNILKIANQNKISVYQVQTAIPSLNIYSGMSGYFSKYFISRLFRFYNSRKLVAELIALEPDVIIFNTSVTCLIAKYLPQSIKKICFIRETLIQSPFNTIIKSNFEKRFDGIAFIAHHEKKFINLQKPIQKIIPDCFQIDTYELTDRNQLRKKYKIANDCFCVLFMGGLVQIKGLDVLLKAAKILGDNFKFIIAGYIDPHLLQLKYIISCLYHYNYTRFLISVYNNIQKLIAEEKVITTGFTTNIAPLMNICDTVVFPSTAAHQPRPCIEAGFFCRSVILSDYEATKEYFINGYNALTFKPGDYIDLARKILYLQQNPNINAQLSKNNLIMSQNKHNYNTIKETVNSFISEVLH